MLPSPLCMLPSNNLLPISTQNICLHLQKLVLVFVQVQFEKNGHIMEIARITIIQVNGQSMVVQDHCVIHTIHLITLIEP